MQFFKIQAFEWTAYIKSWKFREVCLMFIPFIHIYPEQEYIMNVLKDILSILNLNKFETDTPTEEKLT